jgi:sensor histidine kinase YesM
VHDTGAGGAGSSRRREGEGIGLANVERRLALAYGPRASLVFEASGDRGTIVEVTLPAQGGHHAAGVVRERAAGSRSSS